MASRKYIKNIEVKPGKAYFEVDRHTGQSIEILPKEKTIQRFIVHKKKFMIVFSENVQTSIYLVIGEYYKYVGVLLDNTGYDNAINIIRFRKTINISIPAFSRLKKKLIDFGIIAESNGEYFLNPIVGVKSDKISGSLWDLFAKKNEELYKVTEL